MSRLRRRLDDERGFAMAAVVALTSALAIIAVTLISLVTDEATRAVSSERGGTALQAAEAGLDDYLAKLVEDKTYYLRQVHPAESSRQPVSGATVDPSDTCVLERVSGQWVKTVTLGGSPVPATGPAWTGSTTWTWPNGKDNWCRLPNGYEYNLQITAPAPGDPRIKILATGRPPGQTTVSSQWRAIEEWVHFSLVSDFQMIAAGNYSAGSTATTNGKVYAGGTLDHDGIANANLYSETTITGSVTMQNGAVKYPAATIRSQIPQPINFASFQQALDDIRRAADLNGQHFGTGYAAWRIIFLNTSPGTYTIQGCTTGGADPGGTAPTCSGPVSTYTVPTNGAIYTDTTAIVSGTVNGRVTIASNDDAVIAGNIDYVQSGDDVLGIIAKNDVLIAKWGPSTLTWRAAVIAQNGARRSWDSSGTKTLATHIGSTATFKPPYMDMFATRVYDYDTTLQYLPPPWFPALDDAYVVDLFREVKP